MRVVQLLPELNEGGVERGVVELSRELVKSGVESWTISAGGRLVSQVEANGGRHISFDLVSKNPLSAPGRVVGLRRILQEIKPDVIHARSRVPAWLAVLANRKLKIPFVTTVHGFNSVNRYSRVMTYGDKVICVSSAIRDYVVKHYGVDGDRLVVIPRGVDLEHFNPQNLEQKFIDDFSAEYGLEGKFVVTSVGRITQLKDLETFVAALTMAKQVLPNIVGLIVGGVREDKRDYFAKLEAQVAVLNAQDYIHFTGSQDKVPEIYSLSDVVVSSSKKPESFGRSAAEALSMCTPVAATGHGGILDIVLPGKTGQLSEPGDVDGLVEAIVECRKLKNASLHEFVNEHFTLDNMVEKTLNVYRSVAG